MFQLVPISGLRHEHQTVIAEINEILQGGIDDLAKALALAGRKFVDLPDSVRLKYTDHEDRQKAAFYQGLEKVGLKQMHPQLALNPGWASRHLGGLPMEQQRLYVEELIPVVVNGGDVLRKRYDELTREEIVQVFDVDRKALRAPKVRSKEEQIGFLKMRSDILRKKEKREKGMKLVTWPGTGRIEKNRFYPTAEKSKTGFTSAELERVMIKWSKLREA